MSAIARIIVRPRPALSIGVWPLRVAVLVCVALVYAPTLNDPFAGDDYLVLGPVRALGPWELIGKSLILRDDIPYWRPLVSPLYALEVHGIGLRPAAFHAIALGLHLLSVLLVMLLAHQLSGQRSVGLLAGLLFGVHAAHTTTVAQVSSTVELQSVVLYLLTVWCAARSLAPSRFWYLASLLFFVLALLTKESTASAAAVVAALFLLLDPAPAGRVRRAARRAAPYVVIVVPYTLFAYLSDTDEPTGIARAMYHPGLHIGQNLWWMAARLAAPLGSGSGPHLPSLGHLGAALAVVAGLALLVRGPLLARFLVLWTFIALTPLALWRPDLMLGRFTYQAAIPFSMLLALGICALRVPSAPSWSVMVRGVVAAVVIVALALLTVHQNRERTAEALAYGELNRRLDAVAPRDQPATEIVVIGGPFAGPFHARYLQALADTRYGAGTTTLRWLPAGSAPPAGATAVLWPP